MSKAKTTAKPKKEDTNPFTMDSQTKGLVKKVRAALGDSAPSDDIIVIYLRENNNNPNEVVSYILDTDEDSQWRAHSKKTKPKEPEPEPIVAQKPQRYEKPAPKPKPAAKTLKEPVPASGPRITSFSVTTEARPAAGLSFVDALKAAQQVPEEVYVVEETVLVVEEAPAQHNEPPVEEEAPWRVEAVPEPAVVPHTQSPQKKVLSPKAKQHVPVAPPAPTTLTMQLRMPSELAALVDNSLNFSVPPPEPPKPTPPQQPQPSAPVLPSAPIQQKKDEQIDYVNTFAQPTNNQSDPWTQPFKGTRPPLGGGMNMPPQQQAARGGWPQGGYGAGYANTNNAMPYYPQQGNQGSVTNGTNTSATWGNYQSQNNQGYGFSSQMPQQGRQFPPQQQYGANNSGYAVPPSYGRPKMFPTAGYNVTGDDLHRDSEWNLK